MPEVACPIPGCEYKTPDLEAAIVAALITAHSATHPPVAAAPVASAKIERVRRPTISAAGTSADWSYFQSCWKDYVDATKVDGRDRVIQLLECCDEPLRKDLTRSCGSLTDKTEADVLAAIRKLAVREERTMVARVTLHNMRQDRDETVRSFGARLQGQANICKFVVKCPGCSEDVDYTEAIMRDVLSRGLADPEIQMDLLGDKKQDMTLEEVFQFVEAKEAGKRSASRLLDRESVNVASTYKKTKQASNKVDTELCSYCGMRGHGKQSTAHIRRTECPAFGHKCEHCKRDHHFESMCRSKDNVKRQPRARQPRHSSNENAVFDALCTLFDYNDIDNECFDSNQCINDKVCTVSKHDITVPLEHHVYDTLTDTWVRRNSKPQPYINVDIQTCSQDYAELGFHDMYVPSISASVPAIADTGCQSCLTGLKIVHRLGLRESDLIPVTMKMHTANNEGIVILGAVLLRISSISPSGQSVTTRQMTYVTDSLDKLFLSRETCVALGLISESFPLVHSPVEHSVADVHASGTAPCGCPIRQPPPPLPDALPVPISEGYREKLQQYLLDYYRSSTFNTCEHQQLPLMDCPPMKLMVDPDAKPVAHHTPVPVPLHWRDAVKEGLDRDVRLGVIEKVPVGDPVTWCHRMVVCAKKNGTPRHTVDFQALNVHATRETHHTPSPFLQARSVPAGKKKTVFDAWNGYHSVPICEEDRHLTTFITPWGRYRYMTAPQGYIASGDGYTRRYDEIVADIPDKTKCVDDALLWADTLEESFHQAARWLDVCGRNGIILNPDKFVFGADTVEFAGFEISPTDVRPSQRYMRAIIDFPPPKDLTDIRSWFGLVNQVSYTFSMADRMLPFRELLKPGTHFKWNEELQKLFEESKRIIAHEIQEGVTIFDPTKPTCSATDWSKTGIGFWLLQKHCSCHEVKPFCCPTGWKVSLVGSRFTHAAESRYAPIEGEALAVADALEKARYFVLGCSDLIIAVDHKPLLKIFRDRALEDISNTRLRNLKEKTLRYKFRIVHVPGVKHLATDCLSRHPVNDAVQLVLPDDIATVGAGSSSSDPHSLFMSAIRTDQVSTQNDAEESAMSTAVSFLDALSVQSVTWDRVRTMTASDQDMLDLADLIENGMPDSRLQMPEALRDYFQFRDELSTIDGVILYKDRIVIPPSLRKEVLDVLHAAHQGVTSMIARAELSVFWPGITPAITAVRANCHHCNRSAPSNPSAPPIPPTTPEYPFQCLCADYFTYKGHDYLVVVDRYSNWPIVERSQAGATGLISCLRRIFVTYGIPDELASDGGPQFTATSTRQFLLDWGVHHRLSSVAFPHSNCRAEIGVKTVKRLLMDNTGDSGDLDTDKFQRAMLRYRNTPDRDTKLSPAMCIFGRPIRDFIPIPPGKYKPHETWRSTASAREEALRNRHMRCAENLTEHTKRLPPLAVGDHVRLQNQIGSYPHKWDKTGVVIEVRQYDQYVIRVDGSRRVTLRNRKFLRKYIPVIAPLAKLTLDTDIGLPRSMTTRQEESNIPTYKPMSTPTYKAVSTPTNRPMSTPTVRPVSTKPPDHTPLPITRTSTSPPSDSEITQTPVPSHDTREPMTNQDTRHQLIYGSPQPATSQSPDGCENPTATLPAVDRHITDMDAPSTPRRSSRLRHAPAWQKDYDMGSIEVLP